MTNNELRLLARTIILEEAQIYQNPNLIEALSGVNTKELTKLQSESDQIIKTAITCYEEVKKQELQNHNQDKYRELITTIEATLSSQKKPSLATLEANKYALIKTQKFLSLTYPEIYEEKISTLSLQTKIACLKYKAYDGSSLIGEYYEAQKNNKKERRHLPPPLKTFINNDGTYKPLDIIISDKNYPLIDEKIKNTILTSKTFLKKINLPSLTKKELEYLKQIINKVTTIYEEISTLSDEYFEPQAPQNPPIERYNLLIIRSTSFLRTIELKNYNEKINKLLLQTTNKTKRKKLWK